MIQKLSLFTLFRHDSGTFFSWTREPLPMLFYTHLIKTLPVPGLWWSWAYLLLTLSYNVRNYIVLPIRIHKIFWCWDHLFWFTVRTFEWIYTFLYQCLINIWCHLNTKLVHFLLAKFDIFVSTNEKHGTVRLIKYVGLYCIEFTGQPAWQGD